MANCLLYFSVLIFYTTILRLYLGASCGWRYEEKITDDSWDVSVKILHQTLIPFKYIDAASVPGNIFKRMGSNSGISSMAFCKY